MLVQREAYINGEVAKMPSDRESMRKEPASLEKVKELNIREGLPNVLNKLKEGKNVTIAYLGGSITHQEGWRPRSLQWFRERYSPAMIQGINAGVPGTGSDLGAARLNHDVLRHSPDLIFVEFQVNDSGTEEKIIKSMEGIVRQVWKKDPHTDICFVYTIKEGQTGIINAGNYPPNAVIHEKVANHYGIPSIQFGREVTWLEKEGKLIFKGLTSSLEETGGRILFSTDGIHPVAGGDRLYAEAVARSMVIMEAEIEPKLHVLKTPLYRDNWEDAKMYDMAEAEFSGNWATLEPEKDLLARRYAEIPTWFSHLMKSDTPGDSLTIKFKGRAIGIYDIGGPESGQLRVVVDDNPPVLVDRFTVYNDHIRHEYFYLPELEAGSHTVTFTLHTETSDRAEVLGNNSKDFFENPDKYKGNVVYLGKILIVGEGVDRKKGSSAKE